MSKTGINVRPKLQTESKAIDGFGDGDTLAVATDPDTSSGLEELTWLDSKDAATYLRKSENALRIMVCRGYIRPRRLRRRLYFRRVELDRLLESSLF